MCQICARARYLGVVKGDNATHCQQRSRCKVCKVLESWLNVFLVVHSVGNSFGWYGIPLRNALGKNPRHQVPALGKLEMTEVLNEDSCQNGTLNLEGKVLVDKKLTLEALAGFVKSCFELYSYISLL